LAEQGPSQKKATQARNVGQHVRLLYGMLWHSKVHGAARRSLAEVWEGFYAVLR